MAVSVRSSGVRPDFPLGRGSVGFRLCFPLLQVDFKAPFESSNREYRKHGVDDFFAALYHLESTAPPEIYVLLSVSFDRSTAAHRLKSELYSAVPRYQVFLSPNLRDAAAVSITTNTPARITVEA